MIILIQQLLYYKINSQNQNDAKSYTSVVGNVLLWCETNKPLLLATLDIVHNLLAVCKPADLSRIKHSACIQAMEVSTFMSTLSDLLVIVSPDVYQPVLNIVLRSAILSQNCCMYHNIQFSFQNSFEFVEVFYS